MQTYYGKQQKETLIMHTNIATNFARICNFFYAELLQLEEIMKN